MYSWLCKILTTLKLMYRWCMSLKESHKCIWLQGFRWRYSTVNALQIVVMDKNHVRGRGILYDTSYSGTRTHNDPTDMLTSAIYSIKV